MTELERRFHREMVQIYERAKRETGYNATRFLQMVSNQGGLATACPPARARRERRLHGACGNARGWT